MIDGSRVLTAAGPAGSWHSPAPPIATYAYVSSRALPTCSPRRRRRASLRSTFRSACRSAPARAAGRPRTRCGRFSARDSPRYFRSLRGPRSRPRTTARPAGSRSPVRSRRARYRSSCSCWPRRSARLTRACAMTRRPPHVSSRSIPRLRSGGSTETARWASPRRSRADATTRDLPCGGGSCSRAALRPSW